MSQNWKKYLMRHALFTYSRDSLLFFVNLFVWTIDRDLKTVALFNIFYLATHMTMFVVALPALKSGNHNELMKAGIAGLGFVLALIVLLGEDTANYIHLIGVLTGVFNGLYWLVNHGEMLDISSNSKRASFFSFRMAAQGVSKLSVPAVGWLMFTLFGNGSGGYNAVFVVAILSLFASFLLTDVALKNITKLDVKSSLKEFSETKYFWLYMFNGFVYGVSIRSALGVILIPFLIFQVVDTETSLTAIETAVQIVAILSAVYFGTHKKNMSYITRLFVIGGLAAGLGLVGMLVELNLATYVMYSVTLILALNSTNIALGTMSTNYIYTMKNSDEHKLEFIAIRELFAITGFISGYVFVYFNPGLGLDSLQPLLIVTLLAVLISTSISLFLWRYVQRVVPHEGEG